MPSPQDNGFSPQGAYARLLQQLPATIEKLLTVDEEGAKRALIVSNVKVDTSRFKGFDLDDLQEEKQRDATLSAPIFADVRLVDKVTGKNISESAKVRIGDVPYLTPQHGGFMLNGKEYDIFNQLRLRSGLYTHVKQNGDLVTMGNLAKGRNFHLGYDADSGTVRFHMGHASTPLLPMLIATGVKPDDIRAAWGVDFFNQNLKAVKNQTAELIRAGRMISGEEPANAKDAVKIINEYLAKTETNPETNFTTLGVKADKVDPHLLLRASQKLMGVYRNEFEPDDRDDLMFKDIYGPDDLMLLRLNHWRTAREVKNKLKSKLSRFDTAQQIVKSADLSGVMNRFFLNPAEGSAGLIGLNDQINPLQFTSSTGKMTMMGQGGISSEHSIPLSTRALHPSHFGVVDALQTPECYDSLTEVFTDVGWMPWPKVTQATKLACRVGGFLEFHAPHQLYAAPYVGDMISIEAPRVSLLVTPNHRIFYQHVRPDSTPQIKSAADFIKLKSTVKFFNRHAAFLGGPPVSFTLPAVTSVQQIANLKLAMSDFPAFSMEDWAAFMGWYLSEGNASYREGGGVRKCDYRVRISQSRSANADCHERIDKLLTRMKITFCSDAQGFTLSGKQIAHYLQQFGHCQEKFIPEYFFHGTATSRRALFDALLLGDGRIISTRARKSYQQEVMTTTSAQLARDFERLAVGLGYATTTKMYRDKRAARYFPVYEIRALQRQTTYLNRKKGASYSVVGEFSGTVYCATVPGGLLLVRRDQKPGVWCGNSGKLGVVLNASQSAVKIGNRLAVKTIDARSGAEVVAPLTDFQNKTVAYPDQFTRDAAGKFMPVGPRLRAVRAGQAVYASPAEVDYIMPSAASLYSPLTSLSPMLGGISGARAMIGGKMLEQAIPLKYAEAPLVRAAGENGNFVEDPSRGAARVSDVDGLVEKIESNRIWIKTPDGKLVKHGLYDHYPTQSGSLLHHTPVVQVGEPVRKGQLLADSNFTKGGTLALGTHLLTAYLPDKGYSVSGDTYVLWGDSKGSKLTKIKDLQPAPDVRALAVNVKTLETHICGQHAFIAHRAPGKMYQVKTESGISVTATESHSFVTIGKGGDLIEIKPEKMVVGKTLVPALTKIPRIGTSESVRVRTERGRCLEVPLSRDIGFLFGIYVSEGCGTTRHIQIAATEREIIDKVKRIVKGLGYNTHLTKAEPGVHGGAVFIYSAAIRKLLVDNCGAGAKSKRVPDILWSAPDEFVEGFIDGCWCGDGTATGKNVAYSTISEELAISMRLALARLGIRASAFKYKQPKAHWHDIWLVRVYNSCLQKFPAISLTRKHKTIQALASAKKAWSLERVPVLDADRPVLIKRFGRARWASRSSHISKSMAYEVWDLLSEGTRTLLNSDLAWEFVESITEAPHEDYVYDLDMRPHNTFVVNAGLVVHNTHEDGISISESAAKKLTSSHLVTKEFNISDELVTSKAKFRANFPGQVSDTHAARLDDDGVIRAGESVMPGEHLILGVQRRKPDEADAVLRRMGRKLVKPFSDASVAWDEDTAGQVVRVIKEGDKVKVFIRTEKPMRVGDKLSGAGYGNKGIVVRIIPDAEMPHTKDGRPMQVLFNAMGIPGRVNPPAMMEAAAGKIAEKDGKPYYVHGFTNDSYVEQLEDEMKKRGLSEKEALIDPTTGREIPPVYMGPNYWIKLKHSVDTKYSARETAGYDIDGQPLRGGLEGAKRLDTLQSYALMAHGANAILQDVSLNKSDKNDEMWRAMKMGLPLPPARVTFATEKFLNMLKAAGINPIKKGTEIRLTPFTDADTLKQSKGEIKSARFLRADDAVEEAGGLFDPAITGGRHGANWSHFSLAEPVPSPVMEPAIMSLTGLSSAEMDGLVAGAMGVGANGKIVPWQKGLPTGGGAIRDMLEKIDPPRELEAVKQQLTGTKSRMVIDKLNKRGRYLRALVEAGKKPSEAYIISHIPVIPPRMRPAYVLPTGSMDVGSLNYLYRDAFLVNDKLKSFAGLDPDLLSPLRADLYDSVKAIQGLGDPVSGRDYQGVISTIKGSSPKMGYFQRKLMSRPMDAVGRSTIVPDPNLTPDQMGMPEDMSWEIYQARIVRELVRSGMPATVAAKAVEARDERASKALDQVMSRYPVLFNRAPSLHKFSVMALQPHRVDGDALQMPPLPFKGWNADTDGDSMIGDIVIRLEDGVPQAINIADFPHGPPLDKEQREGAKLRLNVDVYPPRGRVQALAVKDGTETGWYDVKHFSRHRHLKMYEVQLSGHAEPLLLSRDASLITINPRDLCQRSTEPKESIGHVVPVAWRIDCSAVEELSHEDDLAKGAGLGVLLVTSIILDDGWIAVATRQREAVQMIEDALKQIDPKAVIKAAGRREYLPIQQRGFRPLIGARQTAGEFYASMTINGMERIPTGYIDSPALEEILRGETSPKTAFKNLASKSASFKTGVVLGMLAGSFADNSFRKDGYIPGDAAAPLRFAGMVAGLEVRMERKRETGRAIRCTFGFIDPVTLYWLKAAAEQFGLTRIVAGVYADHLQRMGPAGDETRLGECVNDLYAHKGITTELGSGENDKRLPWSPKLFTEAAAQMVGRRGQLEWVMRALRDDRSYELAGLEKQDSVSLWRVNKVYREITKSAPAFKDTELWRRLSVYAESTVSYERVLGVKEVPGYQDAYDLSVPGPEAFCAASGATLKNTMFGSLPISEAAVRESQGLLPSKHLFNPGTGDLMLVPKAESVHGLYMLTKEGVRTKLRFKDDADAIAAVEAGKAKATDIVMINNVETTPGRAQFNRELPVKYRDPKAPASMKRVRTILQDVARNDPDAYNEVVTKMKKLGDDSAYFMGMTIGLEDIRPPREVRDPIMKEAMKKFHAAGATPEAAVEIFTEANKQMDKELPGYYKRNPSQVWDMLESGALGKRGQAMQMLVGPVLVNDEFGNTMPFPITKSFAEGLNVSDYFTTLYGQRKGMIDRRISTAEPGEIQKEVIVAALKQQISAKDCGAEGIDLSVDDRSIHNRRLGADLMSGKSVIAHRGDRITEDIISSAKKNGLEQLKVRSPLSCEDDHGICQFDAGVNEIGEEYPIGFNLGALAATTITEPLTQGVLKNFHQGGTAFSKTISGLERIRQLVELPQIMAGQGTIAQADGLVEKIEKLPAGDHKVTVGGRTHFVHATLSPTVVEGQQMAKGDSLSTGSIHPRAIMEAHGIHEARKYLVDELDSAYKKGNQLDLDRRFFETIVKSISDTGYVDDASDHPTILRGDSIPLARAARINKDLVAAGKKPMMISPELKGVVQSATTTDDWMARLGSRFLGKTLQQGVGYGLSSDVGPKGHITNKFVFGIHMNDRPTPSGDMALDAVDFDGPISSFTPKLPPPPKLVPLPKPVKI